MVYCLQLMECSVCFSQRMPCGPKHPIQQVLNHVEVPSSRLSFSSCCFLDPPYFKVQCMRWLSITLALPSSSAQLSRSPMPRMFKFFGGLCGQPFPKHNVRIYCGHISTGHSLVSSTIILCILLMIVW